MNNTFYCNSTIDNAKIWRNFLHYSLPKHYPNGNAYEYLKEYFGVVYLFQDITVPLRDFVVFRTEEDLTNFILKFS